MHLGLTGKTAFVTGGSKGIGLETARGLAREGVRVFIGARRPSALAEAAADIENTTGAKVGTMELDVTKLEEIERLPAFVGHFGSGFKQHQALLHIHAVETAARKVVDERLIIVFRVVTA